MEFEVILHGKPNAGSHKATKGIEGAFCQNLVDNFFNSMNYIKEQEALIVDAKNWKNNWYSIYTFWLGDNVIDTADRPSFIALSIVAPNQYFCLVSDVYEMLKRVFLKDIKGTYISAKGEYLVQNFENDFAFERLVNTINSTFENLSENMSNSFKQTSYDLVNNCYYNLLDCDSKAFVEDWKKYGRIIVSKTCDSKDTRLSNANDYYNQLQNLNSTLQSTLQKNEELTARNNELEELLSNGNSENEETLAALNEQANNLIGEKRSLENRVSDLTNENIKHRNIEKKISNILGSITIDSCDNPNKEDMTTHKNGMIRFIPIVNMFLIILLLVVTTFNSCGSQIKDSQDEEEQIINYLQQKIEELNKIITEKNDQIRILKSNSEYFTDNLSDDKDKNCDLTVWQDGKPVGISEIDFNKKITIFVQTQNGYAFYTSNLKTVNVQNGVPFKLEKIDKNKPIIITYRSQNRDKCNQHNVVKIQ